MSFPVTKNDAVNALNSFKEFCILIAIPIILQTDNGGEYKNELFKEYCLNNDIKHIFSSPYHPKTKGVIEVSHKEILKNVLLYYSANPYNFNLKNDILDEFSIHNNKIHTVTNYKPNELINNTNEEVFEKVLENIKNTKPKLNEDDIILNFGNHILVKKNSIKNKKDY